MSPQSTRRTSVFYANPIRSYNFDETAKRANARRRDPRSHNPLATVHPQPRYPNANTFYGTFGNASATWAAEQGSPQQAALLVEFNNHHDVMFVDDAPGVQSFSTVNGDRTNLQCIYDLNHEVPHAETGTEMTAQFSPVGYSKFSNTSVQNTPTLMSPNYSFNEDDDPNLDYTLPAPSAGEIEEHIVTPFSGNLVFDFGPIPFSANMEPSTDRPLNEASTTHCDSIADEILMALTEPFLMSWCLDSRQPLPSSFDWDSHCDTSLAFPIGGQDSYNFPINYTAEYSGYYLPDISPAVQPWGT